MAYCLECIESIAVGIRRVVTEQIEGAIALIEDVGTSPVTAVHEVRKSCKKIRAALRLVGGGLADYRAENYLFRDLARVVSDVRDLHVLPNTHDLVSGFLVEDSNQADIDKAATALANYIHGRLRAREQTLDDSLAQVQEGLQAALGRAAAWQILAPDSDGPVNGFRNTYARSKIAFERCLDDPAAAHMHEWRKQAKYHWYHLRLVSEAWSEAGEERELVAEKLAERLGDDQDLANYARALGEVDSQFSTAGSEALAACVRQRREALHEESFSIGKRLFSEEPDALARRFLAHWRAWRET